MFSKEPLSKILATLFFFNYKPPYGFLAISIRTNAFYVSHGLTPRLLYAIFLNQEDRRSTLYKPPK
jgi:hypothetical protein